MKNNLASLPPRPKRQALRTPVGIGKHGRKLWTAIQSEYGISDAGGVSLLVSVCRSEDDIQRLRAIIAKDGDTVLDNYGRKQSHPLYVTLRGIEQTKRQCLAALNLDVEPLKDRVGRPSGK